MTTPVAALLDERVAGNALGSWLVAITLGLIVILGLALLKRVLGHRVQPRAHAHALSWRNLLRALLERTSLLFIFVLGLFVASRTLDLPRGVADLITSIFVIGLFIQAAYWVDWLASTSTMWQLERRADGPVRNAMSLIHFFVRLAVWSIALLLILDNLGFDVTALVAGLGIGGIAVALAAQNVLGDLFASLAIVLDRTFEVGDFIIFGDKLGTVERIGIKTTRIRALSGEQLVCGNADLLSSRIHNYKRMRERRVEFTVGVTYQTPPETVARLPDMLCEIIEATDQTRFERAHFKNFGDSALIFEVVHWILSPDYTVFMDVQQAINLAIMRRFRAEGIEFAYPTQTVHFYGAKDVSAAPAQG